jgi:DNA-binding SARP family transcriptional activator
VAERVEFLVLGPLEARRGGRLLPLTRTKVRELLGVLLLHANHVVSVDRLLEELWGDHPPETARAALQVHVSRLRRVLENGEERVLATSPAGYELRVDPERFDALRFERLVGAGRRALRQERFALASAQLDEALALWRGAPLADLTALARRPEVLRLQELRAEATEDRFEAELALGHHGELAAEIELAVAERPFRERLWQQLMLALYRADRQAEALAAYRRARRALDEQLGIEPSAALQRLERAVLVHDRSLELHRVDGAGLREARAVTTALSRAMRNLPQHDLARLALMPEVSEALMDLGEWAAAGEVLDEAIELAAARDERGLEALARVTRVRLQLRTDSATPVQELSRTAQEAIRVFEAEDDANGLAEAWSIYAATLWRRCRAEATERALARAVEYGRRVGSLRADDRSSHLLVGVAFLGPAHVAEGIARCRSILDRPGLRERIRAAAVRGLAGLEAMSGDFDAARTWAAEDRALLERLGDPVVTAGATGVYGMIELLAGDPVASERELRRGFDELTELREKSMRASVSAQLARAVEAQGRLLEALAFTVESQTDAAPTHLVPQIMWRGVRARVLARSGEREEALALAREAVALAGGTDFLNHHGDALADLAHVLFLLGRHDEAAAALGQALEVYERKGNAAAAALARTAVPTGLRAPARAG